MVDIDKYTGILSEAMSVTANGTQPPNDDTHSWTPVDLIATANNPPEPPTISGIVYPGRRHLFSGEPESLKSWAAMVLCVEQIRAGNPVVYIDFEMGGRETLARLRDMRLTDEELTAGFIYLEPDEPFADPVIRADTATMLADRRPALVIIDAFTGALQVHSLDPNKSTDIETFYRNIVDPLRAWNAAVVVLDHLPKDTLNRGKFAIGSERKVGAAEVHLGFEVIAPFGRGRTGRAKIITHKDRPGYLKRPRAAELELVSTAGTSAVTWTLTHPEPQAEPVGAFRPTRLMEKVSAWLELQHDQASLNQIETSVVGKVEYVRQAIPILVAEGYVHEESGPRNARLFSSIKPYREAEDTTSSHLVPPRPHLVRDEVSSTSSPPVTPYRGDERARDEVNTEIPDDLVPDPDRIPFAQLTDTQPEPDD